jgi:hypothetical protein
MVAIAVGTLNRRLARIEQPGLFLEECVQKPLGAEAERVTSC